MTSRLLLLLALTSFATPLRAHDVWIAPESFEPPVGLRTAVALRVGHPQHGVEPVPRNPQRLVRFASLDGSGEQPLPGAAGADPAGLLVPKAPGLLTIVYEGNFARHEMAPAKFDAYLLEEGLEGALEDRRKRGEAEQPGRERYARSIKSLVAIGGDASGVDRPLGLPLELVAEANPFTLAPGAELPLRLLSRGNALPGALVELARLDGSGTVASARSGPDGRVRFALPDAGPWLVTAVHLRRAPDGTPEDWESWWTSLTFAGPAVR
jgi:uncharacterized GH25 family protein